MTTKELQTIPLKPPVSFQQFADMFQLVLEDQFEAAKRLFSVFERDYSYGITNVLHLACQRDRVPLVMAMIERRVSKGVLDRPHFQKELMGDILCDACTEIIVSRGVKVDGYSSRDLGEAAVVRRVVLGI